MKTKIVTTVLIFFTFSPVFAGLFDADVEIKVDGLKEQLEKLQSIVDKQANAALKAIPGERYARLIDDLNGQDKIKKRNAQLFLKSLGHLEDFEEKKNYSVSLIIDFKGKLPEEMDIDMTQVRSNDRLDVSLHVVSGALKSQPFNESKIRRPLTDEEIEKSVKKNITEVFQSIVPIPIVKKIIPKKLTQDPQVGGTVYGGFLENKKFVFYQVVHPDSKLLDFESFVNVKQPTIHPQNLSPKSKLGSTPYKNCKRWGGGTIRCDPKPFDTYKNDILSDYNKVKKDFVTKITNAIIAPYQQIPDEKNSTIITKEWNNLHTNQTLAVYINQKTWDALYDENNDDKLKISAVVHETGDITKIMPGSTTVWFRNYEFTTDGHEPISATVKERGQFRWAARTMTDNLTGTSEYISLLKELKKYRDEYNSLYEN